MIEDVPLSLALQPVVPHDVGVSPSPSRRRFSTAYKVRLLAEAAQCVKPGDLGALLRREGLYSSHLAAWRAAAQRGAFAGAAPRRGPKPTARDPRIQQIAALERQLARVTARAERAEAIVEVQKQVSALLAQIHQRDDALSPPAAKPGRATGPRA